MSRDLLLDTGTHDLEIAGYDLSLVGGVDYIVQKLKIRLLFFAREWYLDTREGVPYYSDVLVKNPNVPNIDTILKTVILETPGVTELTAYQSVYDNALRKLTVTFQCRTDFGETGVISETIP
jgi:hypothetical protein